MSRQTMRASDADRERVAERLRAAAAEGRLFTEELEDRLHQALRARTYGELEALVRDLPGPPVRRSERRLRPHGPLQWFPIGIVAAVVLPVFIVSLALIAQVVIGLFVTCWIWFAVAWLFFGRHRGRRPPWRGLPPTRGHWGGRYMAPRQELRATPRRHWSYWA